MKPKSKTEALARYLDGNQKSRQRVVNNVKVLDEEEKPQTQSSSEDERPERIESDEEEEQAKLQEPSKDEKMRRKFKQALGVENEEDLDEFLKDQLVIENDEGVDLRQLKHKKVKLTMEGVANSQAVQFGQDQNLKLEEFIHGKKEPTQEQNSDSDIEVNRNAVPAMKTIFRNKDGTIREHSKETEKQLHQEKITKRLGQWEKGLKQADKKELISFGKADISDDYKIELAQREMFDDPMRQIKTLIQEENEKPLFVCKYSGPGNRFGIKPGHRWDGVVRGNNFEFKYIEHKNTQKDKHDEQMREYLQNL